jgi:hypothetical protein
MTDREKAFVLNGLRTHLNSFSSPQQFDEEISRRAALLGISKQTLEDCRREQQKFLEDFLYS